jgi:hypothetical protein
MLFSPDYCSNPDQLATLLTTDLKKGANGNDFALLLQAKRLDFTAFSARLCAN